MVISSVTDLSAMSIETASPPVASDCARNALAEIRKCQTELEEFLAETFERLDGLAEELLTNEINHQEHLRQAEREAVDQQVERLAALATELAHTVAEQKHLVAKRRRH